MILYYVKLKSISKIKWSKRVLFVCDILLFVA